MTVLCLTVFSIPSDHHRRIGTLNWRVVVLVALVVAMTTSVKVVRTAAASFADAAGSGEVSEQPVMFAAARSEAANSVVPPSVPRQDCIFTHIPPPRRPTLPILCVCVVWQGWSPFACTTKLLWPPGGLWRASSLGQCGRCGATTTPPRASAFFASVGLPSVLAGGAGAVLPVDRCGAVAVGGCCLARLASLSRRGSGVGRWWLRRALCC